MSTSRLPLTLRRLIDVQCDQFEAAWAAGDLQRIENVLENVSSEARGPLLEELLHLETEFRRTAGQQPRIEEYYGRFPTEGTVIARVFAEFRDQPAEEPPSRRPLPQCRSAPANLLLGLLALQNGLLGRDELLAAATNWIQSRKEPLRDVLRNQNLMVEEELDLLEALYVRYLQHRGFDLEHSLADLSSLGSVRDALVALNDEDLNASLDEVAASRQVFSPDTEIPGECRSMFSATRLRVIRQYKKGGLGLVSIALDQSFNREVALKEIQPQYAHHLESRQRFEREAAITGQLEHPNIAPIYGMGNYADGRPFYAMRFVRGDSLKDAIAAFHAIGDSRNKAGQRSLALRQLLGRFQDVCHAVAYAHSRHILHRDLKPGNIMLGNYGETLLVDWGLAKRLDEPPGGGGTPSETSAAGDSPAMHRTREGSRVGTPAYMSPEQAAGKVDQLGVATDVYSLGATLYALLTNQPPVSDGNSQEVLDRVQKGDWPAPRKVKQYVPRVLEAICIKAMALRPEDRYPSAAALARDIERYLANEPTQVGGESLGASWIW